MPLIAPFKAIRYDASRVGSLSKVVTPPYDVISPEEQKQFYRRHPYNFIRVVYGREYRTDPGWKSRYARARKTLQDWLKKGILQSDPEPGIYPYLQEYTLQGKRHRRWGVVALVRLDSPRIYPHEETRAKPKLDRLRLLEAVQASLSPLFGLVPDKNGQYLRFISSLVRGRRPVASALQEGVRHKIWRVTSKEAIAGLKGLLEPRELVIADGHHRFEAAMAYRNARRSKDPAYHPHVSYNYAMFYLAAAGEEEPGLLPTHRVISGLSRAQAKQLARSASTRWSVHPAGKLEQVSGRLKSLRRRGKIGVGLYAGNGTGYLLEPKRSKYRMDVEWLHGELLPALMPAGVSVSFTQEAPLALRWVKQGKAQAAFLMQPPDFQEVLRRARAASRMPGKTTYFHPKPLAGLVEYKFGPA